MVYLLQYSLFGWYNFMKISFIGSGNMANAIATGIINSSIISPNNIVLFDKNTDQYNKFNQNCIKAKSISNAVELSNYIFLSVKPQNIKDVLSEIKNVTIENKVFISICAGIKIEMIESYLGEDSKIIRTMPNTPLLLGKGVTAITKNKNVTEDEFKFISSIFATLGYIQEVNEDDFSAITALTSSSPAYVYLFIKALVEGGKKLGLEYQTLNEMVAKTLIGSAEMVLASNSSIDDLIKMVKSPNGTTEKALNVLDDKDFVTIIYEAMKACAIRADELSEFKKD